MGTRYLTQLDMCYQVPMIIAEAERKSILTTKEMLTNRKNGPPLKCCHIYSFQVKQPHVLLETKIFATLATKKINKITG